MTDPEKREKVISGLKYCLDRSKEKVHCGDCPYWQDDFESGCHIYDMIRDALALLREQEARVMTRGEIIKFNDWVWVDYKDAFNGYEYKLDYDSDCDRVEWLNGATDGMEEYGKTWRCWSARPSPAQMRDTKWEGDKE